MGIFTLIADFFTYSVFSFDVGGALAGAVHFFIEDTLKIFALLLLMMYIIAFLRAGLPAERVRSFLEGKSRFVGYILAALLGAVTPFCSCSSIPLFLGFTAARIPVGITMAFLITSPTVNEAAVIVLGSTVGWQLTFIYVGLGLLGGIIGGFFFDMIKADRWITVNTGNIVLPLYEGGRVSMMQRHEFAKSEVRDIFVKIWLWVIAGIAIGAALHGYLPQSFIESNLGTGAWWSVPLAVAIGIPTYANATAVIPVIGALIAKGLPVGTAFAFMLSSAAASLPEFIMLKKVMATKLLIIFALYLLVFFTIVGWVLNLIY